MCTPPAGQCRKHTNIFNENLKFRRRCKHFNRRWPVACTLAVGSLFSCVSFPFLSCPPSLPPPHFLHRRVVYTRSVVSAAFAMCFIAALPHSLPPNSPGVARHSWCPFWGPWVKTYSPPLACRCRRCLHFLQGGRSCHWPTPPPGWVGVFPLSLVGSPPSLPLPGGGPPVGGKDLPLTTYHPPHSPLAAVAFLHAVYACKQFNRR